MAPKNIKLRSFHWILVGILTVLAILYSATAIPTCLATASPEIFVDPPESILTTATVGTLFKVNVTLYNVTGLVGLEFKLSWNASLLTCTNFTENLFATVTPTAELENIWNIKKAINNTGGYVQYGFTYQDLGRALDGGYAPINITQLEYPNGKLAAAVLTFNITQIPPINMYYDCNFTISGSKLGDAEANPIPHTVTNGYYKIYGPPEKSTQSIIYNGTTYTTATVSNASVVSGSMAYNASGYTLSFNLTGADGTTGYINVTVPKALVRLNQTTDQWIVKVNNTAVTPTKTENATHTFLYITTTLSTKPVTITGTIPEFPFLMVIPLFMVVTLVAVGIRRRRHL